jgi:NAD dependent epimerase/dehydratase family enzyme
VPGFVLRIVLGELAGMVLGGQKTVPSLLQASGYRFRHPELNEALVDALREQ